MGGKYAPNEAYDNERISSETVALLPLRCT